MIIPPFDMGRGIGVGDGDASPFLDPPFDMVLLEADLACGELKSGLDFDFNALPISPANLR